VLLPPILPLRDWIELWNFRSRSVEKMLYIAYWTNLYAALGSLGAVLRDYFAFRALRRKMRHLGAGVPHGEGVKALHFVYGLKQIEPFPFYAFMAVISAQARHPGARTFFFLHHEPEGPYWDLLKSRVEIVKVPAFEWYGVARVHHYAHKADVVRMLALNDIGGLYLDCDTLTLASMDHLAGKDFVAGVQQTIPGAKGGFCNAIMLCKPGSRFAKRWLKTYRSFTSKGRDALWDFHSVKLPMYLYSRDTRGVHVLAHDKWFFPLWNHIEAFLFNSAQREENRALIEGQLAMHLWHNMAFETLDTWSPERMITEKCLYADLCLEAFNALPSEERDTLAKALNIDLARLATPAVALAS
jgi:Glycosyltransferase sugar-binding region containing DXD motif